jgi:soluble lytic murein transglycosylase
MKLPRWPSLALIATLICSGPAFAGLESQLQAAKDAYRNKDFNKLEQLANKLDDHPLAIYPRSWAASIALERNNPAPVQAFLRNYQQGPMPERVRGEYLKYLGQQQQWGELVSLYRELQIPADADAELRCYGWRARIENGDSSAWEEAKPLWFTGKSLPEACTPLFDGLFSNGQLGRKELWSRLRLALETGSYDLALRLNARLPASEAFSASQLNSVRNQPLKALHSGLAQGNRGAHELAGHAVYLLAKDDLNSARNELTRIASQLKGDEAAYAWGELALQAARRHQPQAVLWYKAAEDTLDANQLEWRVRAALRVQDWGEVAAAIDAMSATQKADPAWRYWRARAWLAQNKRSEATPIFLALSNQHHFYGLLAREELGTVLEVPQVNYKPSDGEIQAIGQQVGVQRSKAFFQMNWRSEAVREWNWAMRGLDDRQLLAAAEFARREKWFDRAIFAAERTKDQHDFSLRFLSPYREVTAVYAKELGLDDAWIYGLIRQESRFIIQARSGVGASGLMQLMPATASWVAKRIGMKGYHHGAVNEIGVNVQLGTYYLKHVLDTLSNQPVLATAAYNAGPGRARNWQANTALEGAIYAETIPFSETRDYVKKVMANAMYYSQVFGQPGPSLKQRLGTIPARRGSETPLADTP